MLSEEKAKRKGKPQNRWPHLAVILPLLACVVMCVAGYWFATQTYSNVPFLDGLSTNTEAEKLILERLPVGSSRSEVERFVVEELQPSDPCRINKGNAICVEASASTAFCGYIIWHFEFRFEMQSLVNIVVWRQDWCI